MVQTKTFMFGVDHLSFVDDTYEVYGVDDPQNCTITLTGEVAEHRGGRQNDIRATAFHSRQAKVSIGTGYCDVELAKLFSGGSITSLGTSAASVTTGTATGINTLYGTSATIISACTSVTINSPTLAKTTDYYIKATDYSKIQVTRLEDGKVFSEVTLSGSSTANDLDSDRGIVLYTGGNVASLTPNEKCYVSVRSAINSINRKLQINSINASKLSIQATVDHDGYRRTMNVPIARANGSIFGNSATEFQLQDVEFTIENSTALSELCDIVIQG